MPDFNRQTISVGNLLLDVGNYRIVKQASQKGARDSIIEEQGRKLVVLAKDILENGLNPFDVPMVVDAEDGQHNFIVVEGNRRLTSIQLMLNPDLAQGTEIHAAFKKLNANHADSIPKVVECMIAPSKKASLLWINRKHAGGLEGAGTEHWSSMSKARADADQGIARPELDAVNYVLANPDLDQKIRHHLEGSEFNITSLKRLVDTKEVQKEAGFYLENGQIHSEHSKERIQGILTDVVTVIATGKHKGDKWTERNIDTPDKREEFVSEIAKKHPKKTKVDHAWRVSGSPVKVKKRPEKKSRTTPTTEQQANLIPRAFKMELPPGKINDVFVELKRLDVVSYRHAVSVLFRVFVEFTLDDYIKKHQIQMPVDNLGRPKDSLPVRLAKVKEHVKLNKVLTEKELKPFNVAASGNDSLISPDTLNAYVHSQWMNPDPLHLKLSWSNLQLFVERLWASKK